MAFSEKQKPGKDECLPGFEGVTRTCVIWGYIASERLVKVKSRIFIGGTRLPLMR